MPYLVNSSRVHSVTIDGTSYTDNFISFNCSDSSGARAGIITTKGQIILGYKAGGTDISEYKRRLFKRGAVVILNLQHEDGTTFRHPRGYLYVLTVSYNPQDNNTTIEVGCRLALAELTDNVENLLGYSTLTIPEEQQTFNNLSSFLNVQNKVLYQNNQGALVLRDWHAQTVNPNTWVSVLGQTVLNIAPLSGSNVIPDSVQVTVSVPEIIDTTDYTIVQEETRTDYEIEFPVKKILRVPPDLGVAGISGSSAQPISSSNNSNCGGTISPDGNDPTAGRDNDTESCSEGFTVEESVQYISARNISRSTVYNRGPAGQTSSSVQEVYGPAIELQNSYFTDKYNYCIQKYVTACSPAAFCSPGGSNNILQARQITTNEFRADGAIYRTTVENYKHVLAAAQTQDWRAITIDTETGEEREEFRDGILDSLANSNELFLESVSVTDIAYNTDSGSKQTITTWTSLASRGLGIRNRALLDARYYGIKTVEVKVSVTRSLNPNAPDRTNGAEVKEGETTEITLEKPVRLFGTRAYSTPPETIPYVAAESVPIDLTTYPSEQALEIANTYLDNIVLTIKGESLGLRVTESLRRSIVDTWYPGVYFFYVDNVSGEVLIVKSDACAWAVSQEGAVVTTAGLWQGISNGTYVAGNNLVG